MIGMKQHLGFPLAAVFLFSGCFWFTSKEDGEQIKTQISDLEKENKTLKESLEKDRQAYTEMIARAEAQVVELEKVLKDATAVLTRNSADFGADMEKLRDNVQKLEGALAEFRNEIEAARKADQDAESSQNRRLEEVARVSGIEALMDPESLPKKKEDLWAAAQAALKEKRYGEARTLAKYYIQRHANDALADDAQVLIAQTYVSQQKYSNAIGALQIVIDEYPKSNRTDEVYYLMGRCFFLLGACSDAKPLLQAVKEKFPKSAFVSKAEKDLADIKKNEKTKCRQ